MNKDLTEAARLKQFELRQLRRKTNDELESTEIESKDSIYAIRRGKVVKIIKQQSENKPTEEEAIE